jgi:two-component system, sensor histidine kinase
MSLLHRLLILVMVSVLPIVALDAINSWSLRRDKAEQVVQDAQNLLTQLTGEQRRVVEGVRNTLATLRRTKSIREADDRACHSLMRGLCAEYPGHLDVLAVDHTGRVRCSTDVRTVGLDLSNHQHIREALNGTEFYVGRQIVSPAGGRRALPLSMPARDDSQAIIGAVTATLDLDWFEGYLASKPLPLNAVLHLADRDGTLLVRLPHVPGKIGLPIPVGLMALMHAEAPGVREMIGV